MSSCILPYGHGKVGDQKARTAQNVDMYTEAFQTPRGIPPVNQRMKPCRDEKKSKRHSRAEWTHAQQSSYR